MKKMNIYETFNEACLRHGKSLTAVLKALGIPSSCIGGWKKGQSPHLFAAMRIAEYLDMSLDDLCFGYENAKTVRISDLEKEWLYIIDHIPSERLDMCKDFLKTHAMIPPKNKEKTRIS